MRPYKIFISLIFLILLSPSCADLDELSPLNSIPADQAINNLATATAAVNGIYDAIQDDDFSLLFDGWLALPQYFSDEADATGTFPTRLEFGNLNVFPANSTMGAVFTDLYNAINNANNVIDLVPAVEELSAEQVSNFVAQAKFIRAQCYLHLVNLWQEVPLILMPTRETGDVLNVPKSSVDEIYAQIISDFTDATQDLQVETGPFLASKSAANAFLARVALYRGNWAEALSKAELVLGADFDLAAIPFLEDQIYSLGFTSTDGNVLNFFYGPEDTGGRYSIGPSMTLINAFEEDDLRKDLTLDLESAAVPFGLKYPSFDGGISGTATDPIFFIRHAEMVLIAAEAAAEMGDFDKANSFYNQVRSRAGLADKTLDASNFVDLILAERFVEFAFEGPFRLIDLRRKGKAENVLAPIGYDPCDNVWPLPQRDVDRNPSLQQSGCCNC